MILAGGNSMHELIYFSGRLIGAAIDPVTWGIALAIVLSTRGKSFYWRAPIVTGAIIITGLLLYSHRPDLTFNTKFIGIVATVIVASLWTLFFGAIVRPTQTPWLKSDDNQSDLK